MKKMNGAWKWFCLLFVLLVGTACVFSTGQVEPGVTILPASTTQAESITNTALTPTGTLTPLPEVSPTASSGLSREALANARYQSEGFATYAGVVDGVSAEGALQLKDGVFQGTYQGDAASELVIRLGELSATGDLDGDGVADAAVILSEEPGGSGVFIHLAAVLDRAGQPVNVSTVLLGDRTQVLSLAIEDGKIVVQMRTHGPDDPMCCPTLDVTVRYLLKDDRLISEAENSVAARADQAIRALSARDMDTLADMANPAWGVRFSPYANVRQEDIVFTPDQLRAAFADSTIYTWGAFDGSGEPIQMTFAGYYDSFIYSQDFANAEQTCFNCVLGKGNSLNNAAEFYPGAVIVEYYFSGFDPQYAGMDWRSLRLVFRQDGDTWYLVGIINDQWTI